MSQDLIKVYTANDNMEADLLKGILEQDNIYCFIQGYQHRSMLGPLGGYLDLDIMVPTDKAEEARNLINAYLQISP